MVHLDVSNTGDFSANQGIDACQLISEVPQRAEHFSDRRLSLEGVRPGLCVRPGRDATCRHTPLSAYRLRLSALDLAPSR